MKKIMFNDKYGLTDAVLNGKKTMTRRIIPCKVCQDVLTPMRYSGSDVSPNFMAMKHTHYIAMKHAHYNIGEEVAIAQSYHNLNKNGFVAPEWLEHTCESSAGYENKMFVRADLMPYRIRITDVKIERLQDITDDDCMKEGIYEHNAAPDALGMDRYRFISYAYDATADKNRKRWWFDTPKKAFAALIDKVSGKGTWESNPWVFVYSFELIK